MRFAHLVAGALLVLLLAGSPPPAHGSPPAQPSPPLRVAFLGDSLTYGLHASHPDHMYRALLIRRLLGDQPAGVAVSVFQDPYGLTDDALRRLPGVLDAEPELIFLEIGNHEAFAGPAAVPAFGPQFAELLDRLQATGAIVIVGTLAWLNYPPGSAEFVAAMQLNAIIRSLCAQRGLTVADLWTPTIFRPELIARPGEPSAIEPFDGDDLHPNDAGHRVLADAFWDAYRRDRARRALLALP